MKKEIKLGVLITAFILIGIISLFLFTEKIYTYLIVTLTLNVIILVFIAVTILSKESKEDLYKKKLQTILKTYDAVLVQSNNFPNLKEKNIIEVENFEDLIDAQIEIRKPIYYKKHVTSCGFVLLDQNIALVNIIKVDDNTLSPLEITLEELNKSKKEPAIDLNILNEIEKTTIIKLNNNKAFKVSPIRERKNTDNIEIL